MAGFTKGKLFWGYWFPVIFYCGAIFVQSAYPSPDSLSSFPLGDKVMHILAYAVLGALFYRALAKNRPNRRAPWIVFLSILLTTLYGVGDEIHQSFVALRTAEGADVLADFAGGTVGALCFSLGLKLFGSRTAGLSE